MNREEQFKKWYLNQCKPLCEPTDTSNKTINKLCDERWTLSRMGVEWADKHPNWTLCKDQMPEDVHTLTFPDRSAVISHRVIVAYNTGIVNTKFRVKDIEKNEWFWFPKSDNINDKNIIAWMPLPKFNLKDFDYGN